jgi:hypothetical protein
MIPVCNRWGRLSEPAWVPGNLAGTMGNLRLQPRPARRAGPTIHR